jgi:flagellar assembly protein FliH
VSEPQVARWNAPDFDPRPPAAPVAIKVGPSVEELAAIQKAAHDEGYAAGKAEGLAAGQAEMARLQQQVAATQQQLSAVLRNFAAPLADLDQEVGEALAALAVRIAGSLLEEAYTADPERLARLVQASLALVGQERLNAEIHLHPADHALLSAQIDSHGAVLVADATLKRGDVRVHAPSLRLDASIETRLAQAHAALRVAEAPDA